MSNAQVRNVADSRVYTVEEIAHILRISRTSAYELMKSGEFVVKRVGNTIRVSRPSFDAWLDGRGN